MTIKEFLFSEGYEPSEEWMKNTMVFLENTTVETIAMMWALCVSSEDFDAPEEHGNLTKMMGYYLLHRCDYNEPKFFEQMEKGVYAMIAMDEVLAYFLDPTDDFEFMDKMKDLLHASGIKSSND